MSLNVIKMVKVTHTRPSAVGVSEVFSNLYLSPFQGEKWPYTNYFLNALAGSKFKENENTEN